MFNGLFDKFRLGDGFDYDDDDEEEEIVEKPRSRQEKTARKESYNDAYEEEYQPAVLDRKKKTQKEEKTGKIVSIRRSAAADLEVCVVKPKGFEDVQDISDKLLAGSAVALNIEGIDTAEAQRIVDFVFGTIHAINGKYKYVSRYVHMFSPESIDLSGENEEELMDTIFEVPLINKDF